jgi:hypothetical protein
MGWNSHFLTMVVSSFQSRAIGHIANSSGFISSVLVASAFGEPIILLIHGLHNILKTPTRRLKILELSKWLSQYSFSDLFKQYSLA